MIFIHGRDQKPSQADLEKLWFDAVKHGLARDYGLDALQAFDSTNKEFVYYGDISNEFLSKPEENVESRREALEELKQYKKTQFTKSKYKKVSKLGFLKEALADTFSGALSAIGVGKPLIEVVAPDMAHYWGEQSYFGSDVRNRLRPVLKQAFDLNEQILLVSHSLGTMISYDNLWKFSHYGEYRYKYGADKKIDLFVTLGSPLGDENIKRWLKGKDSSGFKKYPLNINRWYNFSAEDDYISHDSRLKNDYREMNKLGLLVEKIKDFYPIYNLNVRNGKSNPHSAIGYLIHPKFIDEVWRWMSA